MYPEDSLFKTFKARLPYKHNNNNYNYYEHNNEQFSFLTKHNQGFGNPSILDIFYLGTWY